MSSPEVRRDEDEHSVTGGFYEGGGVFGDSGSGAGGGSDGGARAGSGNGGAGFGGVGGVGVAGVTRAAPAVGRGYGRGPVQTDTRKFQYDRTRGSVMPAITFGASKVDRLDAAEAGVLLDRVHRILGIDAEGENVLLAFDKALFFEHSINGASLLQPGRGFLTVGASVFDLAPIKTLLGVDQRRFFRAFADEVADVNREVIAAYDPHDPVASERLGQVMQVAVERGLQKYPHLIHDSSDAGVRLSVEERIALVHSKRVVLDSTVNNTDRIAALGVPDASPSVGVGEK